MWWLQMQVIKASFLLHGCWGSKLRSCHLYSKRFTQHHFLSSKITTIKNKTKLWQSWEGTTGHLLYVLPKLWLNKHHIKCHHWNHVWVWSSCHRLFTGWHHCLYPFPELSRLNRSSVLIQHWGSISSKHGLHTQLFLSLLSVSSAGWWKAQWVTWLPRKHEDLNLIPSAHIKTKHNNTHLTLQCCESRDRGIPGTRWPAPSAKWVSMRVNEKPCLKKQGTAEQDTWHQPQRKPCGCFQKSVELCGTVTKVCVHTGRGLGQTPNTRVEMHMLLYTHMCK